MRGRRWSAGLFCLVALLVARPLAAASQHHKHKPKRSAPAAASPSAAQPQTQRDQGETARAADDASDAPAPQPSNAVAKPEPARDEPTRDGPARAPSTNDNAPGAAPNLVAIPNGSAATDGPVATTKDVIDVGDGVGNELALGRQEAARLARGRIEVAMWMGLDGGRRQFTYSDPIGSPPRPYLLAVAPLATWGLEVYPLASTLIPVLCDIGFRGRVSRAFAIDSSTTKGAALHNSWTRFTGEVRGRVLVRRDHELGVAAGVEGSYFVLGSDPGVDVGALVPSARTLSFRLGVDGRMQVAARISLFAGGAWLATLSRGEIYNHFRSPHVAGIDTELGVAVALKPEVELRLNGRYTRYFASFDPQVGDTAVAGGALDQQTQMGVAIRYAH